MTRLIAFLATLLLPSLAFAQGAIQQVGPATKYDPLGLIQDHQAESASKMFNDNHRGLNPANTFDSAGQGSCWEDALTTGPYHQFCVTHDAAGNALLTTNAFNGASPAGFNISINGSIVTNPGAVNGLPVVNGNAALQATSTATYSTLTRGYFNAPGDTPPTMYYASASPCSLNSGAGDNGSQVKSADNKCWLWVPQPTGMPITAWGAQANTNVDTQLKAALAWACTTHIPVLVPYSGATPYFINSEIDLGTGTGGTGSQCNGITLRGTQSFIEGMGLANLYQTFKWNGGGGGSAFYVKGPIGNVFIENIAIDCAGLCSTGFTFDTVVPGFFNWLGVWNQTGPAYIVTSNPTNSFNVANDFSVYQNLLADNPGLGGSGMIVGTSAATNCFTGQAVIDVKFDHLVLDYDSSTAGTYGIKLQYANQLSFNKVVSGQAPPAGHTGTLGNSIVISPPTGTGCQDWPTDIVFYHPILQGPVTDTAGWTPYNQAGIHFDAWSTIYTPFPVSTNYNNFWGTDIKGNYFPGPATWTPTDASGATLALTNNGSYFYKTGNTCTLSFDITYPTTANVAATLIGGIPPACVPYGTPTSVVGGALSFTNLGTPINVLCSNIGQCNFYNGSTGTGYSNNNLSGKNVRADISYIAVSN